MSGSRRDLVQSVAAQLAKRTPVVVWCFSHIFERSLRRTFHNIRVANLPPAALLDTPALVVYSNHGSWWDAALFLLIAKRVLGGRPAYAPIDADMARRYGFFSRIGVFGIEQRHPMGARRFLETCRSLFSDGRNVLLLTAQGRFTDSRERPIDLKPGIAHLDGLAPVVTYLPLAIEYTFWLEKRPELLLRFGQPSRSTDQRGESTAGRLARLEAGLTDAMDALASDAISRNAGAFRVLLEGRRGINFFYDAWRRVSAALRGRSYEVEHGPNL